MVSDRKKMLSILILGAFLLPLVALFVHLWTYDYQVVEKAEIDPVTRLGPAPSTAPAASASPSGTYATRPDATIAGIACSIAVKRIL